jgi:hypothetical protein
LTRQVGVRLTIQYSCIAPWFNFALLTTIERSFTTGLGTVLGHTDSAYINFMPFSIDQEPQICNLLTAPWKKKSIILIHEPLQPVQNQGGTQLVPSRTPSHSTLSLVGQPASCGILSGIPATRGFVYICCRNVPLF